MVGGLNSGDLYLVMLMESDSLHQGAFGAGVMASDQERTRGRLSSYFILSLSQTSFVNKKSSANQLLHYFATE